MVESVERPSVPRALEERYTRAGQGHLFRFVGDLSPTELVKFVKQLESFDVEQLLADFGAAVEREEQKAHKPHPLPLRSEDLIVPGSERAELWEIGLDAIRRGKVAVVTLAGGQGTRLGSPAPKGCYDIGLPSKSSLFELQALRLRKLASLAGTDDDAGAGTTIPWYIMTSEATHEETMDFFKKGSFFGIPEENVTFFRQGQLPAIGLDGRLMMRTKGSLAVSPDGNGGIYPALAKEKIVADLRRRHIEYVHMYCVDNALVRVADPCFLGACILKGTDCAAKSILKTDPAESVGVFCRRRDGKIVVEEYSELDPVLAAQTGPDGSLVYNQANIANHFFTVAFLERVAATASLSLHLARKKIPSIDEHGEPLGAAPTGFKLEAFIFDIFERAERAGIFQAARREEFAPLKNAPGSESDSPESCRRMLTDLHRSWLLAAGAQPCGDVELSPLLSYAGEGLAERFGGQNVEGYLFM